MDLIEQIDRWGRLAPDRTAHISGGCRLTYGELLHGSNAVAAAIHREQPGSRLPVAVVGHKQPEMLIAFLGAVKAGRPYIPIDHSLPEARVERIRVIASASLVLTPEWVAAAAGRGEVGFAPAPARQASDPWYIIFTSGSTGEPKGVVIPTGCLESFLAWMLAEHPLAEQGEVFLNQAPFSFDLSVMDLYLSLVSGGTLFSLTQEDIGSPRQLFQSLQSSQVTAWVSTPSFARMCLAEPGFAAPMLPGLRRFLFCGETLAPEVAAALIQRFPQAEVWNTYGPTETTVATTSVRIDQEILQRYNPLPVGYPKPDSVIRVQPSSPQAGDAQPADPSRGEIVIAGPHVSPGYIGRPDLTARAFFDLDGLPAYRTGDWGHFQDGLLFFDGRIDNQLKLHGYRIELGDVESNLRQLPDIQDAAVLPVLKGGIPDHLAAFVILSGPLAASEYETTRALKRSAGQNLPAYMIPRRFIYMQTFPMTPNGKVDRRKLAEQLAALVDPRSAESQT